MANTGLSIHYYPETIGLVNQIARDKNKKLFFFEVDTKDINQISYILDIYKHNHLTVLYHQTQMGYHFLSPTLIDLRRWQQIHKSLLFLNKKCPMITMRVKGNKYPNEESLFYRYQVKEYCSPSENVKSICLFLNKIFGSELQGTLEGELQTVTYRPHKELLA